MSRVKDRFYTQLTGQPKLEVFAESERKFFLKVVDAQLAFDVDPQGATTEVTLHQNGRDVVGKRLSEAEAKRAMDDIEAHDVDVAKRFKEQTQSPGTEAAVRRTIQELQAGEPKYDLMSAQLAAVARQQLPQLKATIAELGALQSVTFKGVESTAPTFTKLSSSMARPNVESCSARTAKLKASDSVHYSQSG